MEISAESIEVANRRSWALRLRLDEKRTFQEIADLVGYGSRQEARVDIQRGLKQWRADRQDEAAAYVAEDLEELDHITQRLRQALDATGVKVSGSRVVHDSEGKAIEDFTAALAAAGRLLDVQERRSKLLGLDQPTKIDQNTKADVGIRLEQIGVDVEQL